MLVALLAAVALAAPEGPRVSPVAAGAVTVDGSLDEVAWAEAEAATAFTRFQPTAGGAPPGRTEVRFLQDDRYLYVGIRVADADYAVRARISPREAINSDDQVGVYLDTFRDGRTGYIFYFNPLGIQQDIRHNNGTWNASWDTAFRSRGRVTADGYEIEIAFPWRSLKYPSGSGPQDWGLILTRKIPSEGAKYSFPELRRNEPRLFSQAARLTGVAPPPRGSGLELIPALTALQGWSADDGGFTGVDPLPEVLRPSLDLRFGITPDIGVTATVNPDFSQVESDVSDVRLNPRFAFRFPETRPFFLDGVEFYQDRADSLYTRSINAPMYGVKVSGREGPWSVGVLHALDRSPLPSFHEQGTPGFSEDDVTDRRATNSVVRARADAFGKGYVGVTLADKRILGTAAAPGDRGTFDAAAVDAEIPLPRRWLVAASTLQAVHAPTPSDPFTWGGQGEVLLSRASGIGWGTSLGGSWRSADLRNETGFLTQSDLVQGRAAVDYTFEPDGFVDTWMPRLVTNQLYEPSGDHVRDLVVAQQLVMGGVHTVSASAGPAGWREGDVTVDGWSADLRYAGQIGALIEYAPSVAATRQLDYVLMVPADSVLASADLTLRPTAGIRLDTTASWQQLVPDGYDPLLAYLLRNRLNWQFTRSLGLRLVGEWTDGTDRQPTLRSSALLTWLEVPGTAAYLGWSESTDLGSGQPLERSIFAKVSVLLRP